MRGRSTKQENKERMEMENIKSNNNKLKEQTHLSGAYIRCLVKQLTTSRTKLDDTMTNTTNTKDHPQQSGKISNGSSNSNEPDLKTREKIQNQQLQPHKKQVRRRLHTTRPYQERLLNMAEARREIVTALKYHRASMKQQEEQKQQQLQQQQQKQEQQQEVQLCSQQNMVDNHANCYNPNNNPYSCFSDYNYPIQQLQAHQNYPVIWQNSTSFLAPTITEPLNFPLPNQTLGLNLNIQDFNNIDTTSYQTNNNPSPTSSSSTATNGGSGFHQAIDDEEMAELRSLGEQHQMEWNDTMNLVTSAWWFKFLKTMEPKTTDVAATEDDHGNGFCDAYDSNDNPFYQDMEFPSWLNNGNDGEDFINGDSCFQQQHFTDYSILDPALPCMDIGEIEGMDGEWLA